MRKYGAFAGAGAGGPSGYGSAEDFSRFFRQGTGGRGGFQTFRMDGAQGIEGLEDILQSFFGGERFSDFGARFRRRSGPSARFDDIPARGSDAHATVTISFNEAVTGCHRTIRDRNSGKKISFTIPPGINDGGKVRLAGQGNPGQYGGPSGDLYISVRVMSDQQFDRKGNDIYTSVTIPFTTAILGGKAEARTLTKTVSLNIRPGTQPGTRLRLKGMGLSVGDQQGDVYVTVNVEIPTNLTERQRKMLEEWEKQTGT